jgi:hypothetical protein
MESWAVLVWGEAWLHTFRTEMLFQVLGRCWTSLGRSVYIHTDTFIMLSGLLTSYTFYKQLERTKRLDIPREYVSRLMRYSTQFCVQTDKVSTQFCVKCVSRLMRYSTHFCVKCVSRLMRYSTQFCVKWVSWLMMYSTQFCVKWVFRLMRYSTQFCVKCVSRLMRYSTQFWVVCVSRLMRYSKQVC